MMQILTYSTQGLYMKDLVLSPVDFFSEGVLCAGHKQKATKVVSLVKRQKIYQEPSKSALQY